MKPIFRILDDWRPAFQHNGYVRQRMGPGTVNVVPHSHYPDQGHRWIAIACTNDKIFRTAREAMGRPDLAARWRHVGRPRADRAIVDETSVPGPPGSTAPELLETVRGIAGASAARFTPSTKFRRIHITLPGKTFCEWKIRGSVSSPSELMPKLSARPGKVNWLGPELGAHNDENFS